MDLDKYREELLKDFGVMPVLITEREFVIAGSEVCKFIVDTIREVGSEEEAEAASDLMAAFCVMLGNKFF